MQSRGVAVISIDDFYLTHNAQCALASSHLTNRLIQHRGQPGTHDVELAVSVFRALRSRTRTKIPSYDKSLFDGQGDRTHESAWQEVNCPGEQSIDVVLLEGWCVGFRPLNANELEAKWTAGKEREEHGEKALLAQHPLEHLLFVNEALVRYETLFG